MLLTSLMGKPWPLFRLFLSFSNKIIILQQIYVISIQYTMLGFEPMTFRHESPSIITKQGSRLMLPIFYNYFQFNCKISIGRWRASNPWLHNGKSSGQCIFLLLFEIFGHRSDGLSVNPHSVWIPLTSKAFYAMKQPLKMVSLFPICVKRCLCISQSFLRNETRASTEFCNFHILLN